MAILEIIIQKNNYKQEEHYVKDVNDVYVSGTESEPEHNSYYASIIFLADNFDESKLNELYVEEEL